MLSSSSLLLVPRSSSPQFWPPFLHHVSPFLSSSSLSAGQQTIRLVTLPRALWLHLFLSCPFPFLLQSLSSLPSVKQAEVFIINHFLDSGRNRFKRRVGSYKIEHIDCVVFVKIIDFFLINNCLFTDPADIEKLLFWVVFQTNNHSSRAEVKHAF